MKKIGIFVLSAVFTIFILIILTQGYHYLFGVKESYTLSSEVSFFNKNGFIEGYDMKYEDCENEEGNFELKIKVGSQESRKLGFEISALLNYEQQSFYDVESNKETLSSAVFVQQSSKELTVILDKELFAMYDNRLIINIRQDIEQLSYKNDLVRDSDTLNFTFYVNNPDGKIDTIEQKNQISNLVEAPFDDVEQNNVIELKRMDNNDKPLIRVNKNEDIQMKLGIGGRNTEQYMIWAFLDSKQVKVNGNLYNNIQVKKNMIGKTTITIENNMPAGVYELEIYGVPSPNEKEISVIKEIISAKRYTVEVK